MLIFDKYKQFQSGTKTGRSFYRNGFLLRHHPGVLGNLHLENWLLLNCVAYGLHIGHPDSFGSRDPSQVTKCKAAHPVHETFEEQSNLKTRTSSVEGVCVPVQI